MSSADRRQVIVEAAVAMADEHGLDAVSMRKLADRLGMGTMSIYSYVSGKDELLDLMLDEVSRGMLVPEPLPGHWRDALRAIALRTRDTLDRHPWAFGSMSRRPRQRANTMRHIEQSRAAVEPLGVDGPTAVAILMAVDDYSIGHALRKHARQLMLRAASAEGEGRNRARPRPAIPPEADFERGLDWLLDGIEAAVAGRARPAAG